MGQGPQIDRNRKETRQHGTFAFPYSVGTVNLFQYDDFRFLLHWHNDIELTVIVEGEMDYQVNDRVYHLSTGSGVFANINALHSGFSEAKENCKYITMNIDPKLIFGFEGSAIEKKYVLPILQNAAFSSCYLDPASPDGGAMIRLIRELYFLKHNHDGICYELAVTQRLAELWGHLWNESRNYTVTDEPVPSEKNISRIRSALEYMDQNYKEKLTLDMLASSCNMCKSGFCRYFRKLTHQTPFEYLMILRVKKSLPLLLSGNDLSITEIAEASGFSNSSYYAEVFRRCMRCSPTEYMKKQHTPG